MLIFKNSIMKKIYSILGILALGTFANAQTNLLPNPGFETWTAGVPDSWFTTGTTVVQNTTDFHGGASSCGITAPASATGNKTISPTTDTPIDVTKTYVFSGWYLDNTPNAKFKYWNQFRNTADTGANALQAASFSTDSASWVFFTAEAMPNAGSTVARPGLRVYGESATNNGGVIYVDDIMFYDKSTMSTIDVKDFDKKVKMNTIVSDALTLQLPSRSTVNIYSVEGKLVSSNRVDNGGSINVSNLAKGNYIVTVQDNFNNKVSRKIIKK